MLPSMAKRIDTVAFIASVALALLAATFAAAAKTGSFFVPSSAAFVFAAIALVFAVAFLLATAPPRLNGVREPDRPLAAAADDLEELILIEVQMGDCFNPDDRQFFPEDDAAV